MCSSPRISSKFRQNLRETDATNTHLCSWTVYEKCDVYGYENNIVHNPLLIPIFARGQSTKNVTFMGIVSVSQR